MAKYKKDEYRQMVILPVAFEDHLMPGTLEFAIHTLVETRMDLSRFEDRYKNDETGRSAYDPKILLKVVLFGYSRGLISSRRIEWACQKNVVFMALSSGQHPNASKQWSGTRSELQGRKERIEAKVRKLLSEHTEEDKRDEGSPKVGGPSGGPDRQKQIERLKNKADRIERWLRENEAKIGPRGKEITSNITDNESAEMYTAHGIIQGYNGQALVNSKRQVIIHGEAFGNSQDYEHVPPVLEGAKENIQAIGHGEDYFKDAILTADSNYHSGTNIRRCEEEGIDAYIPDRFFRRRDPRYKPQRRYWPKRKKRFALEAFNYDKRTDCYVCPAGKFLRLEHDGAKNSGNLYRRYVADQTDCRGCSLRSQCLRTKRTKRRWLNVPSGTDGINYSKQMVAKIDTERGRKIYPQRLAVIEPVFANIRVHKRLDRFTLRGKAKVNVQWLLYCMVHNMEKILNYGVA
jgi:transposase